VRARSPGGRSLTSARRLVSAGHSDPVGAALVIRPAGPGRCRRARQGGGERSTPD
jgi:hypothetical protein